MLYWYSTGRFLGQGRRPVLYIWYNTPMKKNKKSLGSLTKLEAEKTSKRHAEELADELDTLGQDNETKGAYAVMEKGKEDEKKRSDQRNESVEKLTDKRKFLGGESDVSDPYKQELLSQIKAFMVHLADDLPPNYAWFANLTDKGICLYIRNPDGKVYARGTKISGIPVFDRQAIHRLVTDALDQFIRTEEQKKKTGGLWMPN